MNGGLERVNEYIHVSNKVAKTEKTEKDLNNAAETEKRVF